MTNMIQKTVSILLVCVLLTGAFVGCGEDDAVVYGGDLTDKTVDAAGKPTVSAPIPLSGFEDLTNGNSEVMYQMLCELSDTYTVSCDATASLVVTTPRGETEGTTEVNVSVNEGETVTIKATTAAPFTKINVTVKADNHEQRLPYDARFTVDPATLDLYGDNTKVPAATEISYQKRTGGTYVYLNNPEKLQKEDIGQAILRDEGLSGDVQVTWEHSNYTGSFIYLGYQLKNEGTEDAFVTVMNVGYQTTGEWLGQQSWSDYYNRRFELPDDYFTENGAESERYRGQNFLDYTPRIFQPTTYRIPVGEYIYVVGGTSKDAWNETNVAQTADIFVKKGHCTNAAANFFVTGGKVTGTFYCYQNADQVKAEPEEQGYITLRKGTQFGYQYKGVDYHAGLIESNPVFIVNDQTPAGSLPVVYENYYDETAQFNPMPYEEFHSKPNTVERHSWTTNINPQNNRRGVGTDMSSFECVTVKGDTVVIDNEHADGTGNTGNFGNWMIDYHDNITLVNQGDKERTFTINKSANGALMTYVADREGNILATKCTIVPIEDSPDTRHWQIYEVTVPAHSSRQLTVSFLLMGNSYGGVSHWIDVK